MQIKVYKTTLYIELVIQSSCSAGNYSKNEKFLAVNQAGSSFMTFPPTDHISWFLGNSSGASQQNSQCSSC